MKPIFNPVNSFIAANVRATLTAMRRGWVVRRSVPALFLFWLSTGGVLDNLRASTPADGHYTVANGASEPISWRGALVLNVTGLPPDATDPAKWKVNLNGISFKIVQVLAAPSPQQGDQKSSTSLRFFLYGIEVPPGKSPSDVAELTAEAIRTVATEPWKTNPVAVSVSYDGTFLSPADDADPAKKTSLPTFELISTWRMVGCGVALLALLGIYGWAALHTALLRDPDPLTPNFELRTYSLARSQLAFWSVLVTAGFIYAYMVTGAVSGIMNETGLLLLGISSGTAILSQAAGVGGPLNAAPAGGPAFILPQRHKGFLSDILGDAQGANIHRLQMVIWTAVFGCIFLEKVLTTLAFPAFDTSTFGLMGISSGTYVWLKRTES
jgi:hypothetical protein